MFDYFYTHVSHREGSGSVPCALVLLAQPIGFANRPYAIQQCSSSAAVVRETKQTSLFWPVRTAAVSGHSFIGRAALLGKLTTQDCFVVGGNVRYGYDTQASVAA
jgi:hypothetical protein